jgi:homoserine dehydrogenase
MMAGQPSAGGPGRGSDPEHGLGLRTVRLCLLGFGSVARELCALLARRERALAEDHGLRVLVSAAGTRHGSLLAPEGIAAAEVLARAGAAAVSAAGAPAPGATPPTGCAPRLPEPPRPAADLMAASGADVLVELTVMEEDFAPIATGHVETAFALGMDVVTANKGPIAWNWDRVKAAADAAGRRIRFESTVMDGLPVFSLLECALPDCTLLGFEAVFNATTNFIIDAIGVGQTFASALAQVQAEGYAEADPSHDIDGWDAACKAAALANVAMDASISPAGIDKESLADVPLERIRQARADGKRLRLVTSVWRETPHGVAPGAAPAAWEAGPASPAGPVRGRTRATELDIDHPLAPVGAESLGAILHTDLMGDVFVCEIDALVPQTAYGVYADLLQLCRNR